MTTGRCQGKVAVLSGPRTALADAVASRLKEAGATVVDRIPSEGTVDILVWVAHYRDCGPLETVSEEDFKCLVRDQLWAPYSATQAVLAGMRSKGAGWILHLGDPRAGHPLSLADVPGGTVHGPASTVMAALSRLSTAMAAELLSDGIAVNWLSPAVVDPDPSEMAALAETALVLCTEPAAECTARVVVGSADLDGQDAPVVGK